MTTHTLARRLAAEAIGTGLLLAAVVGSGIMAETRAGGNDAIALLANTLATAAALVALILAFGPVSGAHLNPAVTLALAWRTRGSRLELAAYVAAQLGGAICGVWLAHLMFGAPLIEASRAARTGLGQWAGEFTATFALLTVILSCARHNPRATPYAVACIIAAGYWFTSSTSFANPAVTIARTLTDSFAGIRASDAPAFIAAQLLGAAAATLLSGWLEKPDRRVADGPQPEALRRELV